ncbi:MAG TPA: GyrI-like domain-containing protein [Paracoccaceae bacterium]|nr:GyrI-like domain-containing protein [Paracoccaceae bacterium]
MALDAGYGSHEAFSRAFRRQFGRAPETVSAARSLADLNLMEPLRMDESLLIPLAEPRFDQRGPLRLAGLTARYSFDTNEGIPAQWQRFAPHIGHVPGQIGVATYGLCHNFGEDCRFDYTCAVEVSGFDDLPPDFTRASLPAQRYVVFTHEAHISQMRRTAYTIWAHYLPRSGLRVLSHENFEFYGPSYDPVTGEGGVEIWIPLAS